MTSVPNQFYGKESIMEKPPTDEIVAESAEQEDDGRPDRVDRANWTSLFNFTSKSHLFPLLAALALSIATGIIVPALALFLGQVFDSFTAFGAGAISGSTLVRKVSKNAIALAGLGCASWLLNGCYFMAWLVFGELQAKSVRNKLFDGMLQKDMEWYDMRKAGVGALIPRLQTQIRELQTATSQPLGFAIQYTITIFAALGLAFYTAWNLTLVTLATVPISAVILSWISGRMQPSIDAQIEELTEASKLANNAISVIEMVKYFNGQDSEMWQYANAIKTAATWYLIQAQANALQIGFVRIVTLGMFVQGFWYGSHLVAIGEKNAGEVLTAFWACLVATQAIEQILPQMIVLEKGRAAGATLKAVLMQMESGRKITNMIGRMSPRYCEGDIEARNLSFAYPSRADKLALKDASFFFPSGETTFVIGSSGSGKSTLGNLLMRFYTPGFGEIFIDGNPIQTLDINWLRNNITLVQQQSVLFNETIFKNIAFGRRDHGMVRKGEVKKSIETAHLQYTIQDLPKGLDTLVGVGGNAISGGQKQRLAIARARLRDTPILILDEATSALDHISRTMVLEAIRDWRAGKTTIIITHDISQIRADDFTYVLDRGVVTQQGYRQALETLTSGPFSGSQQPDINFPKPAYREHQQTQKWRVTSTDTIPASPAQSIRSRDSMDINFPAKASYIPSVFGFIPDDVRSRRPSQALISPLSPVAVHLHRMSTQMGPRATLRNYTRPVGNNVPLSPSILQPLSDVEDLNVADRGNVVSDSNPATRLQGTSESSLHTSGRRFSIEKIEVIRPKEKRTLTRAEKSRQILSLKEILLTVWPALGWKERIVLVSGFLCALIHAAATPIFSWVFSKLLGTFYLQSNRSQMALTWSLSVLGVAIGDAVASYFMHYLLESCGQAWIDTLRIQAMRRILDQPRAWFDRDKNSLSRLTECLDRNAEEMRNLVGRYAAFSFVAFTMMIIALVWSLIVCWKLTLVGLTSAPLMYAITRGFQAVSGKWEGKSNDAGEVAGSIFTETFGNIRTVRALTLEGYFHKKYAKATEKAMMIGFRRSGYSGLFYGLSDSGVIFLTALIFYYGAVLVASRQFSTQAILTVVSMLLFSVSNINAIIAFIPQMNSSRDTATRLLRLSDLPFGSSHEHVGQVRLSNIGPITFQNLTFHYPSRPTQPALIGINLTIHPSTSTAIVGSSGSGKSTIASLLLGLYPPSPLSYTDLSFPTLTINGRDIRSLHMPTLRSLIAIVPQTPTLFPTTIAANITYGLPETSPLVSASNIRAAAQAAGIDDFIASLPDGYNTRIGDGGAGLSGGQAQRLVIARALVRKPQLLVLDEATSSLDSESAEVVRRTVRGLVEKKGMTVLVITHAREMMAVCERVVVVEKGVVVEEGGFEELMGRWGALRRLLGGGEGGG